MKPRLSLPFDGSRARAIREKAGLTLSDLAKRCALQGYEVHLTAISKVELGRNAPTPGLFRALADALEVEPEALLREDAAA